MKTCNKLRSNCLGKVLIIEGEKYLRTLRLNLVLDGTLR